MKLLFKTDGIVNGQVEFEAGKVYEISDDLGSASRWIKRGAEVVSEDVGMDALGDDASEEVVNEAPKKENKKEKKSAK